MKRQRLIGLFFLGMIFWNYPVLSIVNRTEWKFAIPLIYLYFFITWLLLILMAKWALSQSKS